MLYLQRDTKVGGTNVGSAAATASREKYGEGCDQRHEITSAGREVETIKVR
jgi:hypothetical protein